MERFLLLFCVFYISVVLHEHNITVLLTSATVHRTLNFQINSYVILCFDYFESNVRILQHFSDVSVVLFVFIDLYSKIL